MSMIKAVAGAALCLSLVACKRDGAAKPQPADLMNADRAFAKATAERRMEGFLSFLGEDAATIRPDSAVISGKKAVAERWSALLGDPATTISWKPLKASLAESGDMGFTVGSYEITKESANGRTAAGSGKYITIWRKQGDGSWRVVFDSGVQDTLQSQ